MSTDFKEFNVVLANGNTMTKNAGGAWGISINGSYRVFVFFEVAVTCSTQRAADNAVFSFASNGTTVIIDMPYQFPCTYNGEGTLRWSNRMSDAPMYIANPGTWTANTQFRCAGAFTGHLQT